MGVLIVDGLLEEGEQRKGSVPPYSARGTKIKGENSQHVVLGCGRAFTGSARQGGYCHMHRLGGGVQRRVCGGCLSANPQTHYVFHQVDSALGVLLDGTSQPHNPMFSDAVVGQVWLDRLLEGIVMLQAGCVGPLLGP